MIAMTRTTASFITLLATIATPILARQANASVLVVSPAGPYTEIASAVAVATDGDVLLVKTGTYGAFTVNDKSLTIVADVGATPVVTGDIQVSNLAATREFLMSGITRDGSTFAFLGLALGNNLGTIRIQDCVLRGPFTNALSTCSSAARDGVNINRCDDVAFTHCEISGATAPPGWNGTADGMVVTRSRVTLNDCLVLGSYGGSADCSGSAGTGNGAAGGVGLSISSSSSVWLSGTICRGGDGGAGAFAPSTHGNGNYGVYLNDSELHQLDSTLVGGLAGGPGAFDAPPLATALGAVVVVHAGSARSLDASTVVRASTTRSFSFHGAAGDVVALYSNRTGDWSPDPIVSWVRSVASVPAARFPRYGVVPGSGTSNVTLPVGALPPGVEARVMQMQSVHRELGGALFFGSPRFTVIVDPSF